MKYRSFHQLAGKTAWSSAFRLLSLRQRDASGSNGLKAELHAFFAFWSFCLVATIAATTLAAVPQDKPASIRRDAAPTQSRQAGVESSAHSAASILVSTEEDYRIGSHDVVEIHIDDAPELSNTYRVTVSGTFLMPYLGRLTAKGKTTEELAKTIADGLREKYLYDPQVTVTVRQYNSRTFFIHGSVRSPGVYQIEGKPSLLELLTISGGLMPDHSSSAFIIRRLKPEEVEKEAKAATDESENLTADGKPQAIDAADQPALPQYNMLKVNINGLLKGRFEQNMYLEPGDIVNIPPTEVFFVAGEVNKPGSFPLKEGTTLRQAISLAQGSTFKAAIGRGIIFREDPETGKRQEIAVDIGEVMKGKKEDLPILANDVIIVPNSRMKSVTLPVLSAFGLNAARMPMVY